MGSETIKYYIEVRHCENGEQVLNEIVSSSESKPEIFNDASSEMHNAKIDESFDMLIAFTNRHTVTTSSRIVKRPDRLNLS